MELDVVFLSRLQFAFTIIFHYIFPPFSIGLGALLVIFESLSLITRKSIYEKITRFWIKIFAANFSLGVATGIVMEFEFGTNWAAYARFVGDIFGSPLAAEGIFAFFLESGFLAILLFGWNRVSRPMHLFATIMVFVGSLLSAFWIIVANSWMHTPVAYELVGSGADQVAQITDFWAMVFNPSSMVRFLHSVTGAFIQGGFLVLSVSAFYLLKGKYEHFAQKSFTVALLFVTAASCIQPLIGHQHAQITAQYQPAKMAAFEGHYETSTQAPLYLFGYTDPETSQTWGVAIPGMLSYLTTGDIDAEIKGLDQFPRDEWPKVGLVFQTYHMMVALGMFFIGICLLSLFLRLRGQLFSKKWLLKIFLFSVILPVLANQLGWISAEAGRQPWIVQDLLKTVDAVSPSVTGEMVLGSLIMFLILYSLLFWVWIYVLDKEIRHGPKDFFEGGTEVYKGRKKKISIFKESDEKGEEK